MRLACAGVTVLGLVALVAAAAFLVTAPPARADTNPPTGEILAPLPGDWVSYAYVSMRVRFADPDRLTSLSMTVDGISVGTYASWNADDTEVYLTGSARVDTEGVHAAEARASDWAGNGPTVLSWSFSLDTIRPVVDITYPVGNPVLENGSVVLAWTGSDTGSGIDHYWVRLDDGPIFTVGTATSLPFHDLAPGVHYFTVGAIDVAGNSNSYFYYGENVVIATVPEPPPAAPPPSNATNQVTVVMPDAVPSWAIALVAVNAAEGVGVAWLALRQRREPV